MPSPWEGGRAWFPAAGGFSFNQLLWQESRGNTILNTHASTKLRSLGTNAVTEFIFTFAGLFHFCRGP